MLLLATPHYQIKQQPVQAHIHTRSPPKVQMQILEVVDHTQIYSRTSSAICGNARLKLYQNEREDI